MVALCADCSCRWGSLGAGLGNTNPFHKAKKSRLLVGLIIAIGGEAARGGQTTILAPGHGSWWPSSVATTKPPEAGVVETISGVGAFISNLRGLSNLHASLEVNPSISTFVARRAVLEGPTALHSDPFRNEGHRGLSQLYMLENHTTKSNGESASFGWMPYRDTSASLLDPMDMNSLRKDFSYKVTQSRASASRFELHAQHAKLGFERSITFNSTHLVISQRLEDVISSNGGSGATPKAVSWSNGKLQLDFDKVSLSLAAGIGKEDRWKLGGHTGSFSSKLRNFVYSHSGPSSLVYPMNVEQHMVRYTKQTNGPVKNPFGEELVDAAIVNWNLWLRVAEEDASKLSLALDTLRVENGMADMLRALWSNEYQATISTWRKSLFGQTHPQRDLMHIFSDMDDTLKQSHTYRFLGDVTGLDRDRSGVDEHGYYKGLLSSGVGGSSSWSEGLIATLLREFGQKGYAIFSVMTARPRRLAKKEAEDFFLVKQAVKSAGAVFSVLPGGGVLETVASLSTIHEHNNAAKAVASAVAQVAFEATAANRQAVVEANAKANVAQEKMQHAFGKQKVRNVVASILLFPEMSGRVACWGDDGQADLWVCEQLLRLRYSHLRELAGKYLDWADGNKSMSDPLQWEVIESVMVAPAQEADPYVFAWASIHTVKLDSGTYLHGEEFRESKRAFYRGRLFYVTNYKELEEELQGAKESIEAV